jgi:hypothetical protein
MKTMTERIRTRLQRNRRMSSISLRLPEDLIGDLKQIAPVMGFSGYQPLIRSYIGEGLRRDEATLSQPEIQVLRESLRRHGMDDAVIEEVVAETLRKSA